MPDQNFDPLSERLENNVYQSDKGLVRLNMLQYDLLSGLEELMHQRPLNILDAGGGSGKIARWLAAKGHRITLCDISGEMLAEARLENEKQILQDKIKLVQCPLQDLTEILPDIKFDLILLHGVIEWMEEPATAIDRLLPLLEPGGAFSIMFYNRDKLILKWGINGQTAQASTGRATKSRKLTPTNPLSVSDLEKTINKHSLYISSKAGIRIFYGFFAKMIKMRKADAETIELEKQYCRTEPFASLGEHTHLILRTTNDPAL